MSIRLVLRGVSAAGRERHRHVVAAFLGCRVKVEPDLGVLCGDLALSRFEDKLSDSWPRGFSNDPAALPAEGEGMSRLMKAKKRAQGENENRNP